MQIIQFSQNSNAVALSGKGFTGSRLMTAKEYKEANGLKGAEGKRQFNEYLRTNGQANTAELSAAMSTGELLVKGFKNYERGTLQVTFVRKSSIKDAAAKADAEVTREAALKALGLTVEEYDMLVGAKK